jgi:sulfhydrogenase subunit beta (sulfur reductase)
MTIKIMPKGALRGWIERLQSREFRVVGPVEKFGQYVFDELEDLDRLTIDYTMTVLPPKKYLVPPRETLFKFNTETMAMEATIDAEPTVILGIHTCDMHAITLLDKVHSTGYADQHYQQRREQTYLVSFECLKPCTENAFCKSMGTLSTPEDFDLHFTDLGEVYSIDVGSEKGAELLEGCQSIWSPTDDDYDRMNAVISTKWSQFEYRLDFDVTELPSILGASHASEVWDDLAAKCLNCGACTQVCPTCYCFDVTDETDLFLQEGERVRTWDSCMLEKFAVVAGGHNFRTATAKRLRHRFMRKGKYQYEAYGLMGCVGCGRCSTQCLVDITPVDTFNALNAQLKTHPAAAVAGNVEVD